MCGICGIVRTDGSPAVDRDVVAGMMHAMRHRGPDQAGMHIEARAALGAQRLAIIDVPGGAQPMANEDGSLVLVFNGEIYNYRELRRFLEQKQHRFRTASDSEVVLHLFEELGAAALDHLSGIFAFAVWNTRERQLFLARDRLGIKPLYYASTRQGLTFGSELKVVLADPSVERRIDLQALNEYLSFEYVPTPRTILQDIRRLEPGHWLVWNGDTRLRQYWTPSLARSERRPPVQWRDFASQLRDRLQAAVQEEMVSDVPVGVLLSGGLDSSTVAAFMARAGGPIDSFSMAFDEPSFDESPHARLVAQRLGLRHHEFRLTGRDAAGFVPGIADVLDEPFGDGSFVATYLLTRFVKDHVKVVLGGDGSDELFGGYPTLAAHRLIEYYERAVPWWLRSVIAQRVLPRLPVSFEYFSRDFKMRRFLLGRGVPVEARHQRWMGAFTDEEKVDLLQDWVRPVLGDTYEAAYRHSRDCDAALSLNRILFNDLKLYLEGDVLFKVDRASMANSVEVRVPFLNRRIVEFASALPLELKIRRLTGKYLLRRAMAGVLPRAVLERKKQGFAIPVAHWLATDLKELTLDVLSLDRLTRQGLFQPVYVQRLIDEHLARTRDHRKPLWTLLMFQLWHARYIEG